MDYKLLKEEYDQIILHINNKRISDAFAVLQNLIYTCGKSELTNQLESHKQTYQFMLQYAFEQGNDPEKQNVYNRLVRSILELADLVKEELIVQNRMLSYYSVKREVESNFKLDESESTSLLESISFHNEIENIIQSAGGISRENSNESIEYKQRIQNIFKYIWMTDKLKEADISLLKQVCVSKKLPWFDKSVLVSALLLSTLRFFDVNKLLVLFDFAEHKETQIWQRAFTAIFIAMYVFDSRMDYYPEIKNRFSSFEEGNINPKDIEELLIQYIRETETEKVSKKIREEFLPDMIKMKSTLEEKLDLENIVSPEAFQEKNPEWEKMFEDSPDVYKKFEELSMMQMEGADIFLSAFAYLKGFPFFNEIYNWFMPFYKENETLKDIGANFPDNVNPSKILDGLEKSFFMCSSDKYSFCLNLKHMPEMQRSAMMEMFNMELGAMNEMSKEDEKSNISLKNKTIFTQYLQDLYRFFKLHPYHNQMDDVFKIDTPLTETTFFKLLSSNQKLLRKIGEYHFQKDNIEEAIEIFEGTPGKDKNAELLEKIAFCYQQKKNFAKALETYKQAEIIESDRAWTMQKIAFCHRKLKEYDKSLEYYKKLENKNPEDLIVLSSIGHNYMDKGEFEQALNYYYKVEYMSPKNQKIHRPLAWCLFVMGKFEGAQKYFDKIIHASPNKYDYLNYGHLCWCMGNSEEAVSNYTKGLSESKNDMEWFAKSFNDDKKHLVKHGIDEFEIPLMMDYVRMKIGDS